MMSATSGPTSQKQFAFYDPDGSCWRTWPAISLWGSETFSGTWPKRGSMRSGACFERPTWAPRISGPDCSSLLPTPRTSDTNGPGSHGDGGPDLRTAVGLLPTPTARDWKDGDVRHLDVPTNGLLGRTASRLTGATTGQRSADGSSSSDGQLPGQLTIGGA